MKSPRILLLLLIASAVVAFFALDLGRYLNLEFLKVRQTALQATFAAHPVTSALVFFAIYVVTAALSLPGATLLTLAAGVWKKAHALEGLLRWIARYHAWRLH